LWERRTIDDARGRHVGPEIVHENVGRADALDQRLALGLVAEIAGDRRLAAVERDEAQGVALDERWPPLAGIVAFRPLDLDHVGAEKGQDLPAVGTGQVLAELDDLDAGERFAHLRLLPRIS